MLDARVPLKLRDCRLEQRLNTHVTNECATRNGLFRVMLVTLLTCPTTYRMASGSKSSTLDCGLPARPPTASTALWAHLIRTSTTSEAPKSLQDMSIVVPPMAPLDKNVTSMRVLLHDTQANFEKFSNHVGRLLESIQETKNDLKTMHSVFERDRETLTSDIVDLGKH